MPPGAFGGYGPVRCTYVHPHRDYERSPAFWRNARSRGVFVNPIPRPFRSFVGKKPVVGGRWKVRKLATPRLDGRCWHAYNQSAKKAGTNQSFHTFASAVKYADTMGRIAKDERNARVKGASR